LRGAKWLSVTAVLLLCAAVSYAAASLAEKAEESERTFTLSLLTLRETVSAEGIIVRSEYAVRAAEGCVPLVASGERVSGGTLIAAQDYSLSKEAVSAAASGNVLSRTERLGEAIFELSSDDPEKRAEAAAALKSGVSGKREVAEYSVPEGENGVFAEKAGVFFSDTDGLESIGFDELRDISAKKLSELMRSALHKDKNAAGRVVCSSEWRCAVLLGEKFAAKLGDEVSVSIEGVSDCLELEVLSVSESENGSCTAVLRAKNGAESVAALRLVSLTLTASAVTGLKVPSELLTEENGSFYIEVKTSAGVKKCDAEIIYREKEYCLVRPAGELCEGAEAVLKEG